MKYEETIYTFLILFILIFIIDYFLINKRRLNSKKKKKQINEIDYLVTKFNLNEKNLNKANIIIWISLINSFIISFVSSIIMLLPLNTIWLMLIAFVILFGLIYSIYELYGRHLKRRNKK